MVHYLVATTESIIQVQQPTPLPTHTGLNTPPHSPIGNCAKTRQIPTLYNFITKLIQYSHVQCTTLMTTLVYLHRLKQVIPANSIGMHTTHHRIFLGSLLLAAKFTNDSSPMNKHWTTYTDGLLTLREVNALEIEMIQYIGWGNLNFTNEHLILSLQYFLDPIKRNLRQKSESEIENQFSKLKYSSSNLNLNSHIQLSKSSTLNSLPSLTSSSSISSVSSYASQRKDSIQSIISTDSSQPSPNLSPLQLRPMRLRSSKSQELLNLNPPQSRKSSISIVPIIPSSTSSSSLKHSRKSTRLVNSTHAHLLA